MSKTIVRSEQEMLDFAIKFAQELDLPTLIELVGDVGAGKTTFTRGLALGLGVKESVVSPSFTICRQYHFLHHGQPATLVHYDFYRLLDPGIMQEDLAESIDDKHTITVVEWADSVQKLLPSNHLQLQITLNDDETRTIIKGRV